MASDWQIPYEKICERARYVLQSEQWTDCSFLVGSEPNHSIVKAHKVILAMASPVFEAMLYGPMAERTESIPIVDVRLEVFESLLDYIYTHNMNMESFDFACELYYAANKYMLKQLEEECVNYMSYKLSPENACRGYELAKLFGLTNLIKLSLQLIRTKTKEVLSAPTFSAVSISTIITVFDQEQLNINSELELFNALEKYVKVNDIKSPGTSGNPSPAYDEDPVMETPQDDVSPPPESPESSPTIRDAVKRIRFVTMSAKEFAEGPAKSNLLSQSEILAFILNICSSNCGTPIPEGFSRA